MIDRTVQQLEKILKSPGCKKVPIRVEDEHDAETAAESFSKQYVDFSLTRFPNRLLFVFVYLLSILVLNISIP